jgi:tetratricopeptide (TPR) repeat protein
MRFKGYYQEAIEFLIESAKISSQHNMTNPLGFANNMLGMIYTLTGDYTKAQTHFKIRLDLNNKNKNLFGLGYTFGSMAWLESVQGNFLKASELYSKSIDSFKVQSRPPSIILLTKASILSQLPFDQDPEIQLLLDEAKKQIWEKKNRLDKGRYFISLGNIKFNKNNLINSEENFINALQFTNTYEVKAQGLLGITKVRTELFLQTGETEHIRCVRQRLSELKTIIHDKKSIVGLEVEFISPILDMYEGDLQRAEEKIKTLLVYTEKNSLNRMYTQIKKQLQTLSIYQKQQTIEKQIKGSYSYVDMKSQSLEDIIKYLKEMTNLFHSHDSKNVREKDYTEKNNG